MISVVFIDGSKAEDGRVAGGWAKDTFEGGPWDGGKYLGEGATVWDGEITGMAEALGKGPRDRGVLILADSKAAIQAVKKAGRTGRARTGELVRVIKGIKERQRMGHEVRLAWVKAHVGIQGNESRRKSKILYLGGGTGGPHRGGYQAAADSPKEGGTLPTGWGKGRIARWSRRAATRYTHCRTGKGDLRGWLREIGREDGEECRWCGEGYEDGNHIVCHCEKLWRPENSLNRGAKWRTWEDLDDKRWIILVPKVGGD